MNKKKGYPRKPYSFERVLKDLADDIGYENIETVIEKNISDKGYQPARAQVLGFDANDVDSILKDDNITTEYNINNIVEIGN